MLKAVRLETTARIVIKDKSFANNFTHPAHLYRAPPRRTPSPVPWEFCSHTWRLSGNFSYCTSSVCATPRYKDLHPTADNLVGLNLRTILAEQGHIRKLLMESFDVTLFCEDGLQVEAHPNISNKPGSCHSCHILWEVLCPRPYPQSWLEDCQGKQCRSQWRSPRLEVFPFLGENIHHMKSNIGLVWKTYIWSKAGIFISASVKE